MHQRQNQEQNTVCSTTSAGSNRIAGIGRLGHRKIVSYRGRRYEVMVDTDEYRRLPRLGFSLGLLVVGLCLLLAAVVASWGGVTDATDRAWDDVLALLADNTAGGIDAVDLRDALLTIIQKNEYEFTGPVSVGSAVVMPTEYVFSEGGQSATELWVEGFRWYRSETAARGYVEAGTDTITMNTAIPAGAECLFRYYEK